RQLAHVEVAFELISLVEAPEQPREPGAIRLQEGHLQRRMALEDPTTQEAAHGEHLPHRLPVGSMDPGQRAEPGAVQLRHARRGGLVESERYLELFEGVPQWLVVRIVPRLAGDEVRAEEDGLEAELLYRPV